MPEVDGRESRARVEAKRQGYEIRDRRDGGYMMSFVCQVTGSPLIFVRYRQDLDAVEAVLYPEDEMESLMVFGGINLAEMVNKWSTDIS